MRTLRFSAVHALESLAPAPAVARMRPLAEIFDRVLSGHDAASAAQRMSLVAFLIRIVSAAIAFLSQVMLARFMGTFEYGIFALVWVAVIITGNLSCLGFQTAIIRFLPQYREAGDLERLRGILISSRLFVILSASLVAALAAFLIVNLSAYMDSHYVVPFLIGVIALPMIALGDVLDGTARANGWAARALSPTYIVRPLLLLVFMLATWASGRTIDGVTALLCAVAATYVTSIGQLLFVTWNLDRHYPKGPVVTQLNTWLLVALPIFLVEGFFFLLINADILMVGALMEPDDVAVYYAATKTLALVHFVYFAVKTGVAHQFASHLNNPDKTALRIFARRSVAWTFWPSVAMGAVLLLLGPFLLGLFGETFLTGYGLLFILVGGVVLRSSIGPAESLLNMSGHQNACARLFAGVLCANIILNLLLIPVYGLKGAAMATALATVFETLGLFLLVRQSLGVSMFIFSSKPSEAQ